MSDKVLKTTDINIFKQEFEDAVKRTWVKVNGLNHIYILKVKPRRLDLPDEEMMFYCGYVGVPKRHPYYGLDYDSSELYYVVAHGGLTYASYLNEYDKDYWFFGFDCGHYNDSSSVEDLNSESPNTFKTFEYAKDGVFSMYEMLSQADSDSFIVEAISKERQR